MVLVATGSRPRVPDWAPVDGEHVLTTRQVYPPPVIPEHIVVVGSGVTGVEFTHMFRALGSQVTLVVSRQQVLPLKDAEVAAVLEDAFLERGVKLLKGARASAIERIDGPNGGGVRVHCDDQRIVDASHVVLAVGSIPNTVKRMAYNNHAPLHAALAEVHVKLGKEEAKCYHVALPRLVAYFIDGLFIAFML